jgi:hypothetical protein
VQEYDADEIRHSVEKGVPLFGPNGLNRQQRRALRAKLDKVHQQRKRAKTQEPSSKPKAKRKARLKAALKYFGLSVLVLQAFIYYDSITRLIA